MQREFKKIAPARDVARAYWRHTMYYKWHFTAALASIGFIQLASVIAPLFLRQIINTLAAPATPQTFHIAAVALIGFSLAQLGTWIGWRFEMWAGTQACAKIMADLTKEGLSYLLGHSYQFFSNSFSGALTRRVGRYSDSYNKLWDSILEAIVPALLYAVGITAVLAYQNIWLGLGIAVAAVLFISLQWVMSH